MYLSRLILNPRSRQVQRELARPYEMHRTILRAYPEKLAEQAERVLFRVDAQPRTGALQLLVQSHLCPDWGWLAETSGYLDPHANGENPALKEFDLHLRAGQLLAFRLRANPTQKLSRSLARGLEKGKRVGLYKPEEQLAWLARKGETHGFRLVSATAQQQERLDDAIHRLKLLSVLFEGVLQVTDGARLAEAVASGIGSGKAFGFGLLSLAPMR
ncbi:MAG TPA: type I-E CRISPR-associated protein Cas6/Cse3/CasE [Caldilineaceae bacterium]|nr:type I-E CRISPR-associated protein Cas6/Cse3/CasE [Caldilineaceae bacterium]